MQPSKDEMRKMREEGAKVVALHTALYSDSFTPIEVLRTIRGVSKSVFLLESAESDQRSSRWTFLGYDPVLEIIAGDEGVKISRNGIETRYHESNPLDVVRKILSEYRMVKDKSLPPFAGGLVGYFSFESMKYNEKVLQKTFPHSDEPDVDLMLFRRIIAFDSYEKKMIVIILIRTDDIDVEYENGEKMLR